MKRFLLNVVSFSVFAGIMYLLLLLLWGSFAPQLLKPNLNYNRGAYGHSYTRFAEAKKNTSTDVLVLGSSHAYRGFDPRNFAQAGIRILNLGSSSQTPIQGQLLLQRYGAKLNPGMIIYEVYPSTFCNDGVESSLDIISNDRNDFYSLEMTVKISHVKTWNTFLYATMLDLTGLNTKFSEPIVIEEDTYVPGGYVERASSTFEPQAYQRKQWNFNLKQFEAFDWIAGFAEQNNIPLVLVYAPVTHELYNAYNNNAVFDELMMSYNHPYYNFNNLMNLTDSVHFYDAHHLNQLGVNLFNQHLIQILFDRKPK